MKHATIVLALLYSLCSSAFAGDWGPIRSSAGGNSIDLSTSGSQVGLVWPSRLVPGDDLLVMKTTLTRYKQTHFLRYVFLGVSGGSMHISVTGGSQETKGARSDGSFDKAIFIERANDGSFYFVPDGLKDEAAFKISRTPDAPAYYVVSLMRER